MLGRNSSCVSRFVWFRFLYDVYLFFILYTSYFTYQCYILMHKLIVVHNIKSNTQRLVKITPSTTWGGAGLLGVTIRLDSYGGAEDRLIRVLSVEHNSPAAIAGLVPMKDYLLGTTSASFDSDEILAEVLMVHADRIVELYVYSSESDVVRVVTLMPTFSWGGKGLLGAEVGTGYLHRFPKSCRDTDGQSVERKVRMGVRPTEKVNALEKNEKKDDQSSHVTGEDEMVDSSHIVDMTDSMSGKAMCFAEQLEMEPEPTSEQIEKSKQSSCEHETNSTQNGHSTGSPPKLSPSPTAQEAKAVFDAPPPNQSPLPPPPYAAEVDLR